MPNELYEVIGQRFTTDYGANDRRQDVVEITARARKTDDAFTVTVPRADYSPETVDKILTAHATVIGAVADL